MSEWAVKIKFVLNKSTNNKGKINLNKTAEDEDSSQWGKFIQILLIDKSITVSLKRLSSNR